MILNVIFGTLAALSVALLLWQWLATRRFPLHRRVLKSSASAPALTLLKPLKGCDRETEPCLRSWFAQDYPGPVQTLFAVASPDDPACAVVNRLLQEFPAADARLVVCPVSTAPNAKAAKLAQIEPLARHDLLVISDADVYVPPDFLQNLVAGFAQPGVGLINCFYQLANPVNLSMKWEAIAVNADFWSQVLQSNTLKPMDFALGAVMAVRRQCLKQIGGFASLQDCLADDYQLGHRIAGQGHQVGLCPVVVECREEPQTWGSVWKHQLRWARTIRACQPVPYFFSILSNATLWPLLWLVLAPSAASLAFLGFSLLLRSALATGLIRRFTDRRGSARYGWMAPVKDLWHTLIWLQAFLGRTVEWRGERLVVGSNGALRKVS